jgi:uncharacterized membrane protein HdeD (DUF308 family)
MAVLYILLGIVLIANPEFSALVICRLFGVIMLVPGIFKLLDFFVSKNFYDSLLESDIVIGIFSIFLGCLMLIAPKTIIAAVPIILGLVIIVDSIFRFQLSINLKKHEYRSWNIHLWLSLLTALLGLLLLFNPFAGSIFLTRLVGIALVINGVFNLWGMIFISKIMKW